MIGVGAEMEVLSELNEERARRVTAAALILANLMPLTGVLLLGWEVGTLLFAYWLESAVVGFFNVIKMAQAEGVTPDGRPPGPAPSFRAKIPLITFFLAHYGIFMAVHGAFLYSFFGIPRLPLVQWLLTTLLLFTSHGVSYLVYFLGRGEYRAISPSQQMARPYGRIVVMHLTIILGGVLLQTLKAPPIVLAFLVGLKIVVDLIAHVRSHARYEAATRASTA